MVRSEFLFDSIRVVDYFNVLVYIGAARTYFLTLQRRFKRMDRGQLSASQKKQRKVQRKHNVRQCHTPFPLFILPL